MPATSETGDPLLLTPGPLTTSKSVKAVMVHDWGSRDATFLRINREVGHRSFEMSALDNLGNLAAYRYSYNLAQKYQLESLQGAREIGDRVTESFTMINLGRAYLSVGDYERARGYLQESLDLNRQLNNPQGACHGLVDLSLYKVMIGEAQDALAYSQEALALAEELDLRSELAWAAHVRGEALYDLERYVEAAGSFRQALGIRQDLGETKEAIESLAALGRTSLDLGDLEQAVECVEAVLAYIEEHGPEGFGRPVAIFLGCWQVLEAAQDPRAAQIMRRGCDVLQEVASKIEDEAARQSYLERVPENQALVKACSRAGASGHSP